MLLMSKGKGKGKTKDKGKATSNNAVGYGMKGHDGKSMQWGKGKTKPDTAEVTSLIPWCYQKGQKGHESAKGKIGKYGGKGKGKSTYAKGKHKQGKRKDEFRTEAEAKQALEQFYQRNPDFKFQPRRNPNVICSDCAKLSNHDPMHRFVVAPGLCESALTIRSNSFETFVNDVAESAP